MSRNGIFEEFKGDSSEVVVAEALKFIAKEKETETPFLAVIWYGSPHGPSVASEDDKKDYPEKLAAHFGELVALDRSLGTLREGLRNMGIEKDTLIWYCSDNGGLKDDPDSCGGLKGNKGNISEGGLRVPGIIEWPGHIKPAITEFPASTMDMMPTIIDLLDLPDDSQLEVRDGESLKALFSGDTPIRKGMIPFLFLSKAAVIDGEFKLVGQDSDKKRKLYNLKEDPQESKDLAEAFQERFKNMSSKMDAYITSMKASALGKDYPEGKVLQAVRRGYWTTMEEYQPHFETFFKRPEYKKWERRVPESLRKK